MMNNLSRQIIFLFFCFTFSLNIYGQWGSVTLKDNHKIKERDLYTWHFMGMTYTPPEDGFIGITGYFGHKPDRRHGNGTSSSIESEDLTFAIMYYFLPINSQKDTLAPYIDERATPYDREVTLKRINSSHLPRLKDPGVKSVRYYPSEEAAKKFNADTAVIMYMKIRPYIFYEDRFLGKYSKTRGLLLQKNGAGYIIMYCLYNKEKDWIKNEKLVESLFHFK